MIDWHYIENYMTGQILIYSSLDAAEEAKKDMPHDGVQWAAPQKLEILPHHH